MHSFVKRQVSLELCLRFPTILLRTYYLKKLDMRRRNEAFSVGEIKQTVFSLDEEFPPLDIVDPAKKSAYVTTEDRLVKGQGKLAGQNASKKSS